MGAVVSMAIRWRGGLSVSSDLPIFGVICNDCVIERRRFVDTVASPGLREHSSQDAIAFPNDIL